MIFGIQSLVFIHVAISLIGIVAGVFMIAAMLRGDRATGWTAIFVVFTLATSLTGFLFPFTVVTPAFIFGVVATLLFIPTLAARYVFHMQGIWRPVFVVGAIFEQYLNVFVLVVQSFLKIPVLNALAPTGSEPPFAAAQGVMLILHLYLGYQALRRFRPVAAA